MEFLDAEEAGELGLAVAHGQVGGHHKLVMLRTRATKDDVLIVSAIATARNPTTTFSPIL
jgi:hypothetical protein